MALLALHLLCSGGNVVSNVLTIDQVVAFKIGLLSGRRLGWRPATARRRLDDLALSSSPAIERAHGGLLRVVQQEEGAICELAAIDLALADRLRSNSARYRVFALDESR
jgi:hypothetical protein